MRIALYHTADQDDWDTFVRLSKNGTFLFFRGYMEYHRDRFRDFSLLVRDDENRIIALLPANRSDSRLTSHGGLTYGGFITDERMRAAIMLEVFEQSLRFFKEQGITSFVYKPVPHIYHRAAAEEDLYALFLTGAQVTRCDALAVASPDGPLPWQERRRRMVKKALQHGVAVRFSTDLPQYWEILSANLLSRYGRLPVHSLDEISLLRQRFPEHIKLFGSFEAEQMVAGAVIYESDRVAHVQYTSASERGRDVGALDLLFHVLMNEVYQGKRCFDFGISTEENGRYLNRGLMDQKEGFGARLVAHNHYEIDVGMAMSHSPGAADYGGRA